MLECPLASHPEGTGARALSDPLGGRAMTAQRPGISWRLALLLVDRPPPCGPLVLLADLGLQV